MADDQLLQLARLVEKQSAGLRALAGETERLTCEFGALYSVALQVVGDILRERDDPEAYFQDVRDRALSNVPVLDREGAPHPSRIATEALLSKLHPSPSRRHAV